LFGLGFISAEYVASEPAWNIAGIPWSRLCAHC